MPPPHREASSRLRLSVSASSGNQHVTFLRRWVAAAHQLLKDKTALRELSLALVGDRRMSELHKQFMGIEGPTDVMTFPLEADRRGRATSGEVVIDVAEARRRARVEGTEVRLELLLYAIHGMLHLCGYDDRTRRGFDEMHRMEDRLLMQLGFGRVFDRNGRGKSK